MWSAHIMSTATSRVTQPNAAATHTPGPWVLDEHGHVYAEPFIKQTTIVDKDGQAQSFTEGLVALVYSGSVPIELYADTQAANERLIAAAPDLLDALRGCLDSLEYVARLDPTLVGYGVRAERITAARAAIAKAEGAR
jgi:hypothetical protein